MFQVLENFDLDALLEAASVDLLLPGAAAEGAAPSKLKRFEAKPLVQCEGEPSSSDASGDKPVFLLDALAHTGKHNNQALQQKRTMCNGFHHFAELERSALVNR